ncbi:MAG: lamin tail domain-containing protein [Candidatus Thorarchaeota archaeon]
MVTITNPDSGDTVSGIINVTLAVIDESQITEHEINIDSSVRSQSPSYLWNTTAESDGNHSISCRAQDEAGNWGEDAIWVLVNNTVGNGSNDPPDVIITSPSNDSTISDTVTISVVVTDEDTLIPDIYIDAIHVITANSYEWDTTSYSNGTHTIYAEATDSGGLQDSDTVHVTVNNSEPSPQTYPNAFKVMTYNIKESGANADWKQVVKDENPDILILVETGTWDDNGNQILDAVIDEFNVYFTDEDPYMGYCAQGISFSTSGEAVLSRFPILSFNQIPTVPLDNGSIYDVTHDFIEAVVSINGTDIHIIGSHLKAMSGSVNEERREWETEGIINYMDNLGNVPIMYMGDLNTFSPDDTGDLAPLGDLGYGPMTIMLYPDDPIYGQYASLVHNFTDVFRTLNPTIPGHTYGHQSPSYSSRIDFLLVNSFFASRLINSTCGDTPTANTGSDHYSVDVFIWWNQTTDSDPPAQVTGLNATVGSASRIDIAWSSNTEPDISHYIVYRDGISVAQVFAIYFNDTGLSSNTTYSYEVSAKDYSGNEGPKSESANATTDEVGPSELVVLNEFLPHPNTTFTEEWIELYNPQGIDADISGFILDDIIGGGMPPYTIPADTIVSAGGFLLFNQSTTGVILNNAGDTVNLIKPDGTTVQDSYTYTTSSDDVSYGRETDGGSTWITFASPTPGASNEGLGLHLPTYCRQSSSYICSPILAYAPCSFKATKPD